MSIVDFEHVKITTMTAVFPVTGRILIENVFPLLPWTKLEIEKKAKKSKKPFKIPWPGAQWAGKIFSCRYGTITRGLIKSNKERAFRNSIGIDICTSTKNIAAKLCRDKIQMCGPNSSDLAIETANHLITHLKTLQEEIDYINLHSEAKKKVIDWLISQTEGDKYFINEMTQEICQLEDGEEIRENIVYNTRGYPKFNFVQVPFEWEKGDTVNSDDVVVNARGEPYLRSFTKKEAKEGICYPIMKFGETCFKEADTGIPVDQKGVPFDKVIPVPMKCKEVLSLKYPLYIMKGEAPPPNLDSRILKFFIEYIHDYAYHHLYVQFLQHYRDDEMEPLFIPAQGEDGTPLPLEVGNLNVAMMNYSYSLNMGIDRWELTQLIDGYKNYSATYDNTVDHHVTITVPYKDDGKEVIKRKGRNISFMVYKSGIVTQSGPMNDMMRELYYDFVTFVNKHRDRIRLNDSKPISIKFKPV